jgi:hypothetical protein
MLTDTMFWRLVWKEYRVQRNLWLAVLVLTPVVQLCVVMAQQLSQGSFPDEGYFAIVFGAAAVFMVGCGATLFATEHEMGTFAFQRALPVTAWRVFAAKTGLAVGGGVLLVAALTGLTWLLFVPGRPPWTEPAWLPGTLAVAEVFAWGVFFSLVLRQPLWAALLGLAVPLFAVYAARPVDWNGEMSHYTAHLPVRSVFCLVLLAVDAGLAQLWFRGKLDFVRARLWWPARSREYVADVQPLSPYCGGRRIGWWRLLWLVWREGRWLTGACLLLYGLFLRQVLRHSWDRMDWEFMIVSLLVAGIVFGLSTFTLQQWRRQFRMFAEQGVSPRWVWLSRHAFWLPLLILMTAIPAVMMSIAGHWSPGSVDHREPNELLLLLLFPLVAYAVSQLAAMLIRSPAVAIAASLGLTVLAGFWIMLMVLGDVPLVWSACPLPVVCLFATWWCAPDWIAERRGRRFVLRLAVSLGIPALILLVAVPLRRAYQIPAVDPGFSVAEFTRPLTAAEQQTLDLYDQALKKFWENAPAYDAALTQDRAKFGRRSDTKPKADVPADRMETLAVHHFQATLQLLTDAHQRPAVPLGLMSRGLHNTGSEDVVQFIWLLESEARQRERAGDVDGAWRSYRTALEVVWRTRLRACFLLVEEADRLEGAVLWSIVNRWAVHPQQTRERVVAALRQLADYEQRGTAYDAAVKDKHVRWERFLSGDLSAASQLGLTDREARSFRMLFMAMPWERCRSRRLLCHGTRDDLGWIQYCEATPASAGWSPYEDRKAISRWVPSTLLGRNEIDPFRLDDQLVPSKLLGRDWGQGETYKRPERRSLELHAARIRIALADWRREQGSPPESLDALVGPYFEKLPPDPLTRRPFIYCPRGLPYDLTGPRPNAAPLVVLAKDTPFLWGGSYARANFLTRLTGRAKNRAYETDVLMRGWLFPVPPPRE